MAGDELRTLEMQYITPESVSEESWNIIASAKRLRRLALPCMNDNPFLIKVVD